MFPDSLNLSIRAPVNDFIQALVANYGWVFKAISGVILKAVLFIEWILRGLPWWLVILAFMNAGHLNARVSPSAGTSRLDAKPCSSE